jgi:hypothetical protein
MISTRRQLLWMVAAAAAGSGLQVLAAEDDDDTPENAFISPCGKPFRAPPGAPYPIAAWFAEADKSGDGKLDRAEFLADAEAFFKVLDRQNHGVLDNFDVQYYEHRIAPEVLGLRVDVQAGLGKRPRGARLWLAQNPRGGMDYAPSAEDDSSGEPKSPHQLDESKQGASPFSLFEEPEPVTAADFQFSGSVTKANFLKLADAHFTTLDVHGAGFLTLAGLPKTPVQKQLERHPRRRS